MSGKRIGVFGGTFDPPHTGHILLATKAIDRLHLDRLLCVLTPVPPHKLDQYIIPVEHRLAMLKLAIAGEPGIKLSRIEMERPGPHYTADTLRLLGEEYPSADLILIIGEDSLRDLPTWHRPTDILAACHKIGVFRRPDTPVDLSAVERLVPGTQAKVRFVDAPLLDISSRDIRQRIQHNQPFQHLLPPDVYAYIMKHKLYG